jgi:hypothetical protein
MMFSNKTVLIVSKTDDDAMTYLREKVMFIFKNLPQWMQQMWLPIGNKCNDHEVVFANGSSIKSLTSAPDCLRSNASSLNIIDESGFIRDMSLMWTGGYSTLQHGGTVIVISTTNGVGNWYWGTWTDAEAGLNDFNPITINWWDMDWSIEYIDPLSGEDRRIAPTDNIRKCETPEEILKYGMYWSPWLEEQYRNLQERGESWKFEQEVLADFVGSGNTILGPATLAKIQTTLSDDYQRIDGHQTYVHPISHERLLLSFAADESDYKKEEGLWVWQKPFIGTPSKMHNGRVVDRGVAAHAYSAGVDLATGKGKDYHAIEILDVDTQEQVAELMIRCKPRMFMYMVDYIGRFYNNALMVVERNNGGDAFIDDLRTDLMYPNLWRKRTVNDKPTTSNSTRKNPLKIAEYGHYTGSSTKPNLNRLLVTHFREDDEGFTIYSKRLYKQMQIYVRKKDRAGKDTDKTEAESGPGNHDDLVMAGALALVGLNDVGINNTAGLLPFQPQPELSQNVAVPDQQPVVDPNETLGRLTAMASKSDPSFLAPMTLNQILPPDMSAQAEIQKFAKQLGGTPVAQDIPAVRNKRHTIQ